MKPSEALNIITGFLGFGAWALFSWRSPENSSNIALGALLILLGFWGRDTITEIITHRRGRDESIGIGRGAPV